MADDDLAALRARRMEQLRAQQGGGGAGGGVPGRPGPSGAQAQEEAVKRQQAQEDQKNSMLAQILTQEARARLSTLMLAKPDKARQAEGHLLRMAQMGQMSGKVSEPELIRLLEQMSDGQQKTKVKFDRRRAALDSDDED